MTLLTKSISAIHPTFSKQHLTALAEQQAKAILQNQQADVLKIFVELKRYELYVSCLKKELKNHTLQIAKSKGKRVFNYANADITIQQRTEYDYSTDACWSEIQTTMNRLNDLKKRREQLLKSVKGKSREVLNQDTGKLEFIYAPKGQQQEVLAVKL